MRKIMGIGECSAVVNLENQLLLFDYVLKCSSIIRTSDLFIVDVDAINNCTQFKKKSQ